MLSRIWGHSHLCAGFRGNLTTRGIAYDAHDLCTFDLEASAGETARKTGGLRPRSALSRLLVRISVGLARSSPSSQREHHLFPFAAKSEKGIAQRKRMLETESQTDCFDSPLISLLRTCNCSSVAGETAPSW